MPISSFYGLQTSLRGLLAQQRLARHHRPQHRQRVDAGLLAPGGRRSSASDALQLQAGAVAGGAGAHLGSGVDVQAFRRVRDGFLDLQYRAQNTQPRREDGARRARSTSAELSLAEPCDNGINTQLSNFWDAWSDFANAPDDSAARQALVEQAQRAGRRLRHRRRRSSRSVASQAQEEYDPLTGARAARSARSPRRSAQLNDTIKRFVTAGDPPNDLMDRRDQLLDELSALGQVSVEDLGDGSMKVDLRRRPATRRSSTTRRSTSRRRCRRPSGRLGAPARPRRHARRPHRLPARRPRTPSPRRSPTPSTTCTTATARAQVLHRHGRRRGRLAVASPSPPPTVRATATGAARAPTTSRWRRPACAAATATTAYRAFVARVGGEVSAANRQEANAAGADATPSRTAARASPASRSTRR